MRLIGMLRRPAVADAGLALLLAAASYYGAEWFLRPGGGAEAAKVAEVYGSQAALEAHRVLWWACAAATVVAMLMRRRWPLPALVLAGVAVGVLLSDASLPVPPFAVVVVIALYTLASTTRSRTTGVLALACALLAAWLLMVHRQLWVGPGLDALLDAAWRQSALSAAAVPVLLLGIAWAAGDNARTRRAHVATLEQRAADLQREREQRDQLAVAAERARITRELHDVVAHGISVMVVQAQGGAAALRRHPDRTEAALGAIIATGRASLTELRHLLGLARRDAGDQPELKPQPGIGSLPALVDQMRAAGTPVALRVVGEPVPLPVRVDLSVYRIVQEGLTNTLKHAGDGAQATVSLAFGPAEIEIDVADDGCGARVASTNGNGLRGITERVGALGGTVESGPCAGGGFAIHARLPIADAP